MFIPGLTRNLHHLLLPQLPPRPILRLKQHRPGLQALQAMPLSGLDIQHNSARHHINCLSEMSFRVVEILLEVPTNTYTRLRRILMPMYGHHRPRLQRIQHTLALIIRRIPQIHGHAEPRTLLRLRRQLVKDLLIYNHSHLPALPREMGTCPSGNEPTQR